MEAELRKHVANFGDDLKREDIKKLMFLRKIPQGLQERFEGSAVELFQHLEEVRQLDFEDPFTVIQMMRDINKEKWAVDTEKIFGVRSVCPTSNSSSSVTTSEIRPVQETHTFARLPETEMYSRSARAVLRKQPSPEVKLSNTLKRRMKLDNIVEDEHVEELEKLGEYNGSPLSPTYRHVENTDENCMERQAVCPSTISSKSSRYQGQHACIYRTSSSVSKRSSGYSSGAGITYYPEDYDDEEEDGTELGYNYDEYFEKYGHYSAGSESRSSTIGSQTSSFDGYTTANDDDEGVDDDLTEPQESPHSPIYRKYHNFSIYAPPRDGLERLEGEMAIEVRELQRAVEKKQFGRVYHSNCFPSFSSEPGLKFQLHLYPNSMGSSSCAVYLVVHGWSNNMTLPSLKIEVAAFDCALSREERTNLNTIKTEVDIMKDTLPPTPPNVDYKNIILFPSLIPHHRLCSTSNDMNNQTIVIKVMLEYKAAE